MREILISSTVCVVCLAMALISQLISPSVVQAEPAYSEDKALAVQQAITTVASSAPSPGQASLAAGPMELGPDDPNPSLFTMAAADDLGGPMQAAKERMTPSGLRITDLELGRGEKAVKGVTVSVDYRGALEGGSEFDSSYGRGPFRFPLGAGRVIKGWDEGVAGMKVGGKRRLVIPPDLAYGKRGAGRVIPPNATLIFEVELLDVQP